MSLEEYQAKRDLSETPEPGPEAGRPHRQPIFVVQEHHATRLHYDFRLEADGVLKSWAVPRRPSLDPSQKRLAVRVEDHPLGYATFAGTIPEGHYGAGEVRIWDHGTYDNLLADRPRPQSMTEGIDAGRLEFALRGEKLRGRFALVRMKGRAKGNGKKDGKENWLLIKMADEFARRDEAPNETARPAGEPGRKAPATAPRKVRAEPRQVELTHPEKVWYPDAEITKGEVFKFYQRIARRLLPHLKDRPCTLERLPDGLGGPDKPHFFQKDTPAHYPDWVPRVEMPTERGKTVRYVLVNDEDTLLYLVNQGTLTFHPWLSRVADPDRPDFVLFDLDPGEAGFADVVAVARQVHALLQAGGVKPFVKTSGKTGLHVLAPWSRPGGYEEARTWARGVAGQAVEALPEQATLEIRKAKRGRRVYIDVLQNAKGHHVVPPYVVRAVAGAPVSTPLSWRELTPRLDPEQFNVRTIFRRLARQKRDPMAGLLAGTKSG